MSLPELEIVLDGKRYRRKRVARKRVAMVALAVVVAVGVFTLAALGVWVESRVSKLEGSVSALQKYTGTGRFSFSFGGSLESRVSALESKSGGSRW